MDILTKIADVQMTVKAYRDHGKSLGFVPTMGALHEGHISLLRRSVAENDISICSIFVNPIQFDRPGDLEKYPRNLKRDYSMLESGACNMVFAPSVKEMYPEKPAERYDFGALEEVMEGRHRPGHFNGVAVVVKRLFEICRPHRAYFGEKDYQQLMIIRELVKKEKLPVEIVPCPIIREADGLAMSSRNARLTKEERAIAPVIFSTLHFIREHARKTEMAKLLEQARQKLHANPGVRVEYILVADEKSLQPVQAWEETVHLRAFVALFLGNIRLIDNMKL
jgi:pantoate--beta-alanine ligase